VKRAAWLGQWLAMGMSCIGIGIEVGYGAEVGYILITTAAVLFALFTKLSRGET
jgi:hypothetical protein